MHFLEIRNLGKNFQGVPALQDLSFTLEQGEVLGLIGPNGSGKSTFFNVLTHLAPADQGQIFFQGEDITQQKTYEIARRGVARSFQDAHPMPQITVRDNLDLAFSYRTPVSLASVFWRRKALHNEEQIHFQGIRELLGKVGLQNKEQVLAQNLSYGQGKLLEILKILARDAKLILLDEPFSGLFPEMILLITKLLKELAQQGKTILLIEHNMELIAELSDRVIVLDAGKKIADGKFAEIRRDALVQEAYLGK